MCRAHVLVGSTMAGIVLPMKWRNSQLHPDTKVSVRVALKSDPGRFDSDHIARAIQALEQVLGGQPQTAQSSGLSQVEVANILGCSRWSVRRLVAAGKLTPRQLLGGLVRFDRQQVEALLGRRVEYV